MNGYHRFLSGIKQGFKFFLVEIYKPNDKLWEQETNDIALYDKHPEDFKDAKTSWKYSVKVGRC